MLNQSGTHGYEYAFRGAPGGAEEADDNTELDDEGGCVMRCTNRLLTQKTAIIVLVIALIVVTTLYALSFKF